MNLRGKTRQELRTLIDKVKVSDLSYEDKTKLISKIESKLGITASREYVLKSITESQPDYSDIIGG